MIYIRIAHVIQTFGVHITSTVNKTISTDTIGAEIVSTTLAITTTASSFDQIFITVKLIC